MNAFMYSVNSMWLISLRCKSHYVRCKIRRIYSKHNQIHVNNQTPECMNLQEKMINISETNDNFPDKVESFKLFLASVVNVSSCVESQDFSRSPL